MSRQQQIPNYNSSHPSQQHGQFSQPLPNTSAYPSYPDGSHHSISRSRTVPFPESQGSSAGHPQTYISPSQTTQNMNVVPYQQERQIPPSQQHGQFSQPLPNTSAYPSYPDGSHHSTSRSRTVPFPESQGSSAGHPQTHISPSQTTQNMTVVPYQQERQGSYNTQPPLSTNRHAACRFPDCGRQVFFDGRVNELREWCSDEHMQAAIMQGFEKPCRTCQRWPRRNGYKLCSGEFCGYSTATAQPQDSGAAGYNQGLQVRNPRSRETSEDAQRLWGEEEEHHRRRQAAGFAIRVGPRNLRFGAYCEYTNEIEAQMRK